MRQDTQAKQKKEEHLELDQELLPKEKLKKREALIKSYVDVRRLAQVASGMGDNGLSRF
jgi:hypothetical protein